jgi:polyphosphate kinase 2 (PPK2 family)
MLEYVDLKQSVPKDEYKQRLQPLQERLYSLQGQIFEKHIPVAIVFEGWAAAGKGTSLNTLAARLDPRGFRVVPIVPPRTIELAYPWMWRYWLRIPAAGQMVGYDTSWYRRVLIERLTRAVKRRQWEAAYDDIRDFESQLAADGTVILKFWLHISKKEQKRRFKKLLASKLTAWQVTPEDEAQHDDYNKYRQAVEDMLARTEAPHAPWTIVAATDRYYTRLKIIETIVQSLALRLGASAETPPVAASQKPDTSGKSEADQGVYAAAADVAAATAPAQTDSPPTPAEAPAPPEAAADA